MMSGHDIAGATALVTGARGIATALIKAGAQLLAPLVPGSTVVTMSSGAALFGSPLSGGYAGAKAAIRWLTAYAAEDSRREGLGIRFVSVLPQLTPATALGAVFAAAYAARQGTGEAAYTASQGLGLTPEQAGQAITALVTGDVPAPGQDAYLLTPAGPRPPTPAPPGKAS
jgi:NAD(P)-dependent dehydrogenase (short-subunit alcohol dehydrogenase family)